MTETSTVPKTSTQYREDKQEEAKKLEGTGNVLEKHMTLPFTKLGWPKIDQIIVSDSKGRLVLVKKDGKIGKVTLDLLEDILLPDYEEFVENLVSRPSTKPQCMAMFMREVETTAIADLKAASLVRKFLRSIQRNSDDPEERLVAKILNRCLEGTLQVRTSRILPMLTKLASYRFWTPEDSEPSLEWWTEYLGLKYNPTGFWEIVDLVIGQARPCLLPDKVLSAVSDEFYLVRGQQTVGSRGAYSTHDKIESIRETEAALSVLDPIYCEAAAVGGQVAVIEDGHPIKGSLSFSTGFKSKYGEKVVVFDRTGAVMTTKIVDTSMNAENKICAAVARPKDVGDWGVGNTSGDLYMVKLPTKFIRKTTATTTAWMSLTAEPRWAESQASTIEGREVPAHIAIAGADYE